MTIVRGALEEICAHAREVAPCECCGLLVGRHDAILTALRARNRAREPTTRYELAPEDHFAALRMARASHLDVLGFYHSHPQSRAWPSRTDIAEAAYPDAVYLIVGVRDEGQEARVFRIREAHAMEIGLTVVQDERAHDPAAPLSGHSSASHGSALQGSPSDAQRPKRMSGDPGSV